MEARERNIETVVQRLVLDIKALTLLEGSDSELKATLTKDIIQSSDDDVSRFVGALSGHKRPGFLGMALMAFGELVLASILVLIGVLALVPGLTNVTSPDAIAVYIANGVKGLGSPLSGNAAAIGLVMGCVLLLAAFYTLRQAAKVFKEAGLSLKEG